MHDTVTDATTSTLSTAARAFWAKSGDGEEWLPLAQHMLDSACVAERLWDHWVSDSVTASLSAETGLDAHDLRSLVTWLACTHDIGKATITFQLQLDHLPERGHFAQRLIDAGLPTSMSAVERHMARFPHGMASGVLVERWLIGAGTPPRHATRLASVADAHHGITSDPQLRVHHAPVALDTYAPEWTRAQAELLDWAAEITCVRPVLQRMTSKLTGPPLNLLTGVVIMADWIASNADTFPLAEVHDQRARAERVLDIDLTAPWRAVPPSEGNLAAHMRSRFNWPEGHAPRPVQEVVDAVARTRSGATLMIIEAPTGEGKTEAAMLAAEHLAAASGAGGVMLATPTMSTADGLLERTITWAERASAPGETVSMFLGHSKNGLNSTFRTLRHRDIGRDTGGASRGVATASQWMSGRKKGILSSFCVATVDQVLFMALQARHSMLRHLGLAGKVVIIDEAHAYDAYMTEYLGTALRWLARYRVPVVLLSATLPIAQRRQLIDAYESQFAEPSDRALSAAYPLVTVVGADGFEEIAVPARDPDIHAEVHLIGDGDGPLAHELSTRLGEGGCALVICNTIARAQRAFGVLDTLFPGEVELHHAGFIASDRIRREERLREELGPQARPGQGRPARRVVVATQVAEQSLDIDVDLLVTDIAPVDLVIQRIGRLHRHDRPPTDRPEAVRQPHVLIRGIESMEPVPEFDSGVAAVYDRMLLLSSLAALLCDTIGHGFTRPDDIAPLVQAAYSPDPAIPDAWAEEWAQAVGESEQRRASARSRSSTWRFPDPESAADLDAQFQVHGRELGEQAGLAQVRDSDPSIEVIPIIGQESAYRLLPWTTDSDIILDPSITPPDSTAYALATSTVRLPSRFGRYPQLFETVISALESSTPVSWRQHHLLQGQLALRLDEGLTAEIGGRRLRYDQRLGLADITDRGNQIRMSPGASSLRSQPLNRRGFPRR